MIIDNALQAVFPYAGISVEHDLLGAARGLFKNDEGIACILGTGSNSCYYKNGEILENVPSIGYIYGDEGSGAYMGKKLLRAYLKNHLPSDLHIAFTEKYNFSLEQILDATYNKEKPMQFMASFVKFLGENSTHQYVIELVKNAMDAFLHHQVFKYPGYRELPLGFVGSVAYHFRPLLESVLNEYDLKLKMILQKPIEGLVEYHQ